MEFGRVSGDHYAGYVVEDSDLEYSDCSEADSSEDEGCTVSSGTHGKRDADLSSEDEFEKEMNSEAMATLRLMLSPTAAAQAAKGHVTRATPTTSANKPQTGKSSRALARARQRRSSAEQPRKTVRFSEDLKTDDGMEEGTSTVSNCPEVPQPEEGMTTGQQEYYDDIYFDSSGSEDERGESEGIRKIGKKVRKMTNDELFYDPKMDEEDEKWMKRQRMTYLNATHQLERKKKKQALADEVDSFSGPSKSSNSATASSASPSQSSQSTQQSFATDAENCVLPKSDAVLNCPACMTTLCLDCQRHDVYANQYRAMFVVNCCIQRDEVLKYFPKPDKRSRKRKNRGRQQRQRSREQEEAAISEAGGIGQGSEEEGAAELYHPVRCSQCNTEVAVFDKDEIYHFFNVLTSAPG